MVQTKKQFHERASLLKSGDKLRIKRAGGWQRLIGWDNYRWIEVEFISYEDGQAIFLDMELERRVYVEYRQIKTGQVLILWDQNGFMQINRPAAQTKDKVVSMYGNAAYKHY